MRAGASTHASTAPHVHAVRCVLARSLAMIAVAGMVGQELVTQQGLFGA